MNRLTLLVLIVLLTASPFALAADARPGRPNVLMIAVDDLNHYVHYMGRNKQAATPNMDRLAARGVVFRHAYTAAPSCTPSRSALMSGLRPGSTGVYENYNVWSPLIPEPECLPAQFRAGGYVTLAAGKVYHGGPGRPGEYDEQVEYEGGNPNFRPDMKPKFAARERGVDGIKFAPIVAEDKDLQDYRTADWCIEQLGKKHDKPFFLACGLYKPHMPWFVPQKYYDMFPVNSIELPPTMKDDLADVPPAGVKMAKPNGDHANIVKAGKWKEAIQGYLAAMAYTDMNVGRVLDALDKSEFKDNTIIVFWGDHGWHLGEKEHWRKFALWEEATRVPYIWVVPGMTKPGQSCERTVDLMSVYPTVLDLCGIPTPKHVEGKSIKSLLADPASKWDTPAVSTFLFNNHAVRSEDWRYIRYSDGSEELYDEKKDPYEYVNVAGKPENAAVKAELAKSLPTKNVPDPGNRKGEKKSSGDE